MSWKADRCPLRRVCLLWEAFIFLFIFFMENDYVPYRSKLYCKRRVCTVKANKFVVVEGDCVP